MRTLTNGQPTRVPYAAKHTARATANADIATSCLTWCAAVVSAVADESKPSSKHSPQDSARFLPRVPIPKDLSQAHELLPPNDKPTWADKVAGEGETRAAQRHLPHQPDPELAQLKRMYAEKAKEIQSLKEELAKRPGIARG